ncbi:hypothetical protein BDR04DRAFT_621502 [Suillus decipiens]|nr:hypothetical protein BDR04DRAFT_621502 [Suillus decipiens]
MTLLYAETASSITIMPILRLSNVQRISTRLPGGQMVIYPCGIKPAMLKQDLRALEDFIYWDDENTACQYLIVSAPYHKSIFSFDPRTYISIHACTEDTWKLQQKKRLDTIRVYIFGPEASAVYGGHTYSLDKAFALTKKNIRNINEALENLITVEIGELDET